MKLVRTFGPTAKSAEALIHGIEQRGAVNTAKVELTVRTILADVTAGRRCRAAGVCGPLRRAWCRPASRRLASRRCGPRGRQTAPDLKAAMELAQRHIRSFAETAVAEGMDA